MSSTGKKPQNPLMLLGQYSDEELDEDSSDGYNHDIAEDASLDIDDEGKNTAEKEIEDVNVGDQTSKEIAELLQMDKDFASSDPSQKLEKEIMSANDSDDLLGTKTVEGVTYPALPSLQLVTDRLGWKMVLHEESNQYYYWNVSTGETSWQVPDVLALETGSASVERTVGDTEENGDIKLNCELMEEGDCFDDDDINRYANQRQETSLPADAPIINGAELEVGHFGENISGIDLSSQLVKHGESMLEILKSLKSSNYNVEGQDLKSKYTLEIEIRLADIKTLASHGSSLLPFWLHSESRLKQIEGAIDDLMKLYGSASMSGFEATLESHECTGDDIKIDSSRQKPLFPVVESHSPKYAAKESNVEASCNGATGTENVPSICFRTTLSTDDVGGETEITGIETKEFTPKPDLHSSEEVDMDVDMEVEDTSASISGVHYSVSSDLSNLHNTVPNQDGVPPREEWVPPLPLDDEPFPPPPPEDEPFPPLPPDEPPQTSYPPASQSEYVHPFPYSEHYNLSYPGSSVEYYGHTHPEVPGTTLYTQAEGGQAAVSHLPHYYDTVSSVYAVAPQAVNTLDPSAYYGLQNGTSNPVPLISSAAVKSSATPSEPVPQNLAGSFDSHAEARSSLLLKTNHDNHRLGISPDVPDVPDGAPATSSVTNSVSVSSTSDTASVAAGLAAAAATTSKVQSKVLRSKKRAAPVVTTLRSNKKVSSLVDKWKAAKEELHEEEEEPEDAYEAVEKKRQREIEEWRARQIASGEAKENANFQPVVGDWRERVKRKRAQKMKETGQSSSDVPTIEIKQNNKPDLVELAKGLPSGWQAYWDDSTKKVYYGNVLTSETSWTRP
ncbi:hypothetical protein ACJIZ3_012987 [Penstemon smallii]|uniref:WW domain-containing protein n=1 Tax=Penstemon smallii TaxID=265156 RepID=A0ABD3UNY6_9LAMI